MFRRRSWAFFVRDGLLLYIGVCKNAVFSLIRQRAMRAATFPQGEGMGRVQVGAALLFSPRRRKPQFSKGEGRETLIHRCSGPRVGLPSSAVSVRTSGTFPQGEGMGRVQVGAALPLSAPGGGPKCPQGEGKGDAYRPKVSSGEKARAMRTGQRLPLGEAVAKRLMRGTVVSKKLRYPRPRRPRSARSVPPCASRAADRDARRRPCRG